MIKLADAGATLHAGGVLARLVRGGDAIALIGDLGAGKTTFVSGAVAALGGGGATSPTFALINEYRGGRLTVWHLDLYRIGGAHELAELGLEEVIGEPSGIALVEWADRFAVMPSDHLRVVLAHVEGGNQRRLTATGTGPRGAELASALVTELLGC